MRNKGIFTILIIIIAILNISLVFSEKYQCHIDVKSSMVSDPDCSDFVGKTYTCNHKGNFDFISIMNICIASCLPESKYPEKCAEISVTGKGLYDQGEKSHHTKTCSESEKLNPATNECESKCTKEQKWNKKLKSCENRCKENEIFKEGFFWDKCVNIENEVLGCRDDHAINYNEFATIDDGSCKICDDEYTLVEKLFGDVCVKCLPGQNLIDGSCIGECSKGFLNDELVHKGPDWVWDNSGKYVDKIFGTKHIESICVPDPCYDFLKEYDEQESWLKSSKDLEKEKDIYNQELAKVKGKITYKRGNIFIENGIKRAPASVGTELRSGDVVVVEEGGEAAVSLFDGGLVKITEKNKFMVPSPYFPKSQSKLTLYSEYLWCRLKKATKGESYEINNPAAAGGVRG